MVIGPISRRAALAPARARSSARREALADPHRGRGHDVEVAGVRRQVVAAPGDLEQDRDPGRGLAAGRPERAVVEHAASDRVAGHVRRDLGGHRRDRGLDRGVVGVGADRAVDGVAHQDRRLGRVQDDDRLAVGGPADRHEPLGRRLGELVDVGPCPRAGRLRGDRRDDLGVGHRRHPADGGHHRDRRLAAAGDHVQVGRVQLGVQVDGRDDGRADGGRRQVDRDDPGLGVARRVRGMDLGTRRLVDDPDTEPIRFREEPVRTVGRRLEPPLARVSEAVRVRIDADQRDRLQDRGAAQLDDQIRPDVARADDRDRDPFSHVGASREPDGDVAEAVEPWRGTSSRHGPGPTRAARPA